MRHSANRTRLLSILLTCRRASSTWPAKPGAYRWTARPIPGTSVSIAICRGLGYICGSLLLDTAALNKIELLPWDAWEVHKKRSDVLTPDERSFFDRLAHLTTGGDALFGELQVGFYESDRRLDQSVHSYLKLLGLVDQDKIGHGVRLQAGRVLCWRTLHSARQHWRRPYQSPI